MVAPNAFVTNLIVTNMFARSGHGNRRPRSRRERPAKPALSRDGIVAAAVAVMRAEGLEHVTMRRLAAELDTGPASLYVYVRNTAELHAAVLDELLGLVGWPLAGNPARWADSIIDVLWSYTGILVEHPGLARSALVTRPSGPNYLALVERLLTLLRRGGSRTASSAWGVDILLLFATSIALEHGTRRQVMDADERRRGTGAGDSNRPPQPLPDDRRTWVRPSSPARPEALRVARRRDALRHGHHAPAGPEPAARARGIGDGHRPRPDRCRRGSSRAQSR